MSNKESVCRLCLKNVPTDCLRFDPSTAEKLQQLIPELKLTSSTDPICNECKETLEESHKIKRTCSSSNKLINFLKDYLGITESVELKELIKGNNKKPDSNLPKSDHVCRICLKGNEGAYISIADVKTDEFGLILSSCLSTLDENLTINPLICKICIDSLHKMCTFIKKCVEVENNVKPPTDYIPDEKDDMFTVVDSIGDEQPDSNLKLEEGMSKDVSAEAIENSKCPNNRQRWKAKLQENDTIPYTGPLPRFNFKALLLQGPSGRTVTLELWLAKVEMLSVEMKWSDATIKSKVLERLDHVTDLRGLFTEAARDSSWAEFKETLLRTFPGPDDYFMAFLDMTRRKKKATETYVQYYKEKKALLEQFNMSDEQMVSFLLGGIMDANVNCTARMAGYKKPEELLQYLKTCDGKDNPEEPEKEEIKEQDCASEKRNSSLKCVCCDQKGHSSIECPLIKKNEILKMAVARKKDENNKTIIVHENKIIAAATPEKSSENKDKRNTQTIPSQKQIEIKKTVEQMSNSKATQGQKCSCCDKLGHSSMECPLIRKNEKDNTTKDIVLLDDDDATQKNGNDSSGDKCSFCDQIGHSSLVCPLIDVEKNSNPTPRSGVVKIAFDKNRVDKVKRPVSSVSELGTDELVCEDKKKSTVVKPAVVDSGKKCSCCDKLGHTSMDCPLIRRKQTDQTKKDQKIPLKRNSQHPSRQNKTESPPRNIKSELPPQKVKTVRPPQKNEPQWSSQKNKTERPPLKNEPQWTPQKDKTERPPQKTEPQWTPQKNEPQWTPQNDRTERPPLKNEPQWTPQKDKTERPPQKNEPQWTPQTDKTERPPQKNETQLSSQTNKTERPPQRNESSRRCRICRSRTHFTSGCYRSKNNADKGRMTTDKSVIENKSHKPKAETSQKCSRCDRYGHSSTNCPLLRANKTATEQSSSRSSEYRDDYHSSLQMTSTRKCLCCNKTGHSSLDCPLLGTNRNELLTDKFEEYEPQDVANAIPAQPACVCCNNPGHTIDFCPFYNFFNRGDTEVNSALRAGQVRNMLERDADVRHRRSRWSQDDNEPPQKKAKQEDTCYFCNIVGHSSMDCLRNKLSQMQETMQGAMQSQRSHRQQWQSEASITDPSVIGMSSQNMQVCELCNRMGHNRADCFVSRFDRSNFETQYTVSSSRQCLYCGKFGHIQSDCPKVKPFSKWMN